MNLERSVSSGALGFVCTEFIVTATHAPTLWYHPIAHELLFGRFAPSPAMDFYGRTATSLLGGLVFFGAAQVLFTQSDAAANRTWMRRMSVWLASVLLATAALHVAVMVNRVPVPIELEP